MKLDKKPEKPKNEKLKKIKPRNNMKVNESKNEITFSLDNDDDIDVMLETVKDMESDTDNDSLLMKDYINIAIERIKMKRSRGNK